MDVAIVGGGPAGMVAACLLARAGVDTLVLEQNADFSREFRGEILQPRFHQAMKDVGLFEHLKDSPHEEIDGAHVFFHGLRVGAVDARWLDKRNPHIWWMTQPDLLNGLDRYARAFPNYRIWFDSKVKALAEGRTLSVMKGSKELSIQAKVILGADGRFSTIRRLGGFRTKYDYHDLDVVWFVLDRPENYTHYFSFYLGLGAPFLILPKHPKQLQCGMVFRPGRFQEARQEGLDAFRKRVRSGHPVFRNFADSLQDFSAFHPLKGNRALVETWAKDGVVLIGDAAHTCSPAGGIGVSIAVETAVVAAQVILEGLKSGDLSDPFLGRIQTARIRQIREVHRIQGQARVVLSPAFWPLRILVPLFAPLLTVTRLLPLMARRLLAQKESLAMPTGPWKNRS